MTRTLVTGLAGFTGHYVREALSAAGHEVLGIGHAPADGTSTDGYYAVDLLNESEVRRVVRDAGANHVINLAAIAAVDHGNVAQIYQTNIIGTRNLLAALSEASVRPQSVIIASSANIYGNATEGRIAEDARPAPANDYGVSKVATEYVASIYADKLPLIVTRPFNYTGVGQAETFVIPKIVAHARRGETVLNLGNLDVSRDFSDVRMVASAYARLLQNPRAVGRTVNICSERASTLREIIAMVEALSALTFEVRVDPRFVRANEVRTLFGSNALLRELVGDLAIPPLQDTLAWMLQA